MLQGWVIKQLEKQLIAVRAPRFSSPSNCGTRLPTSTHADLVERQRQAERPQARRDASTWQGEIDKETDSPDHNQPRQMVTLYVRA
jgi:hypothetical protein